MQLGTFPGNVASERVAEKSGFAREGVLRSWLEQRGERRDVTMWSRLPGDPGRSAGDPALERRVGDEECGQALLGERIDGVERLGRRARLEGDQIACVVEAQEGVGQPFARSRRSLPPPGPPPAPAWGKEKVDERCRDRAEDGKQRSLEPAAEPGHLDEHDREQHGRGLTSTSRLRTCASSCASTPSELSRASSPRSSPVETASAEPCGPRPAESARGKPSWIR